LLYLKSGIIEGIGPKMAKRLVDYFEDETLDIIETHPERLLDIPGVGRQKAARIAESWETHHINRRLGAFLIENNIPMRFSAKILAAYGSTAIECLQDNPYHATRDIPGFHFPIADALAAGMGILNTDPQRIRYGLMHLLQQHASDGHMFMLENGLVRQGTRLLGVEPDPVRDGIEDLVASGDLIRDKVSELSENSGVFLKDNYQAEKGIADRLCAILSVPLMAPVIDTRQIVAEVVKKLAIKPSAEQLDVLKGILSHRVAIITGGPGTGKTTLIRSISTLFSLLGKTILLTAPTGRAARRLSEVAHKKASTVHKLLEYNFTENSFGKNETDPLETDVLIVDEASMVDAHLMFSLLKALPLASRMIMVGDAYQLPSVGPGNVLSDMIRSRKIQTFELKTIYRQARESAIVMNAHRIRSGQMPDLESDRESGAQPSFYFIEQQQPQKVLETIAALCSDHIPRQYRMDPIAGIQVLSPMHKGVIGTMNLNQVLQEILNPNPLRAQVKNGMFKLGDKVLHLKNNYQKEVFNGDIGIICSIENGEKTLSVDYDGTIVDYDYTELDELTLAYAITIHKSQGSEYPVVVVPVTVQHRVLLQRNLLYTAITRGKTLAVFIGTRQALEIALNNDKPRQRLSSLAWRLKGDALTEFAENSEDKNF